MKSVGSGLLRAVDEAHSLPRILDEAVRVIGERLQVDACAAFLVDADGHAAPAASYGADASGAPKGERVELAVAQALEERRTVTLHTESSSLLVSPMILRGHGIGAIVLRTPRRDYSSDDVAAVETTSAQLAVIVEDARI